MEFTLPLEFNFSSQRNGESQAPDGRYRYSYYVNGKQKNL